MMYFEQLFEQETSTYTYLLADKESKEAILIDPVLGDTEKYINHLKQLGFTLRYTLDTHVHADHITASGKLKELTGCGYIIHELAGLPCAIEGVHGQSTFVFGRYEIEVLFTPGHTPHHAAFLIDGRVFTGDCLLINGCGRTDFQGGSSKEQWHSLTGVLYQLPQDTLVYPGHDYRKYRVSCIGQERDLNPRTAGQNEQSFVKLMAELNLPDPKFIHEAVPANQQCGLVSERDA